MFIRTEQTPNPASLKFLPGCEVMLDGNAEFTAADTAEQDSPLAGTLFKIDGVAGVFLGRDFITVTKTDGTEWPQLKPLVLGVIMDHFSSGRPVMHNETPTTAKPTHKSAGTGDSAVVDQIIEILDTRVRPAVAMDGGDITFDSFEDGVVYLHLRGACAGCPSSTVTLKAGIENLLKHFVPEVKEVRAVN